MVDHEYSFIPPETEKEYEDTLNQLKDPKYTSKLIDLATKAIYKDSKSRRGSSFIFDKNPSRFLSVVRRKGDTAVPSVSKTTLNLSSRLLERKKSIKRSYSVRSKRDNRHIPRSSVLLSTSHSEDTGRISPEQCESSEEEGESYFSEIRAIQLKKAQIRSNYSRREQIQRILKLRKEKEKITMSGKDEGTPAEELVLDPIPTFYQTIISEKLETLLRTSLALHTGNTDLASGSNILGSNGKVMMIFAAKTPITLLINDKFFLEDDPTPEEVKQLIYHAHKFKLCPMIKLHGELTEKFVKSLLPLAGSKRLDMGVNLINKVDEKVKEILSKTEGEGTEENTEHKNQDKHTPNEESKSEKGNSVNADDDSDDSDSSFRLSDISSAEGEADDEKIKQQKEHARKKRFIKFKREAEKEIFSHMIYSGHDKSVFDALFGMIPSSRTITFGKAEFKKLSSITYESIISECSSFVELKASSMSDPSQGEISNHEAAMMRALGTIDLELIRNLPMHPSMITPTMMGNLLKAHLEPIMHSKEHREISEKASEELRKLLNKTTQMIVDLKTSMADKFESKDVPSDVITNLVKTVIGLSNKDFSFKTRHIEALTQAIQNHYGPEDFTALGKQWIEESKKSRKEKKGKGATSSTKKQSEMSYV